MFIHISSYYAPCLPSFIYKSTGMRYQHVFLLCTLRALITFNFLHRGRWPYQGRLLAQHASSPGILQPSPSDPPRSIPAQGLPGRSWHGRKRERAGLVARGENSRHRLSRDLVREPYRTDLTRNAWSISCRSNRSLMELELWRAVREQSMLRLCGGGL